MRSRTVIAAMAAVAILIASGCTAAPTPRPRAAARTIDVRPIDRPGPDDRRLIDGLLNRDGGERTVMSLPDLDFARLAFPGTLVPHETLGRRLVAVIFERGNSQPHETVRLVYEGRLVVAETRGDVGALATVLLPNESAEGTSVGASTAEVRYRTREATGATVTWSVGDVHFGVSSPDLKKADVVRVARSLSALPTSPTAPFHVTVDDSVSATDRAGAPRQVKWFEGQGAWRYNRWNPAYELSLPRDDVAARKEFPVAFFPRETLGRKLAGIVAQRTLDGSNPRESLTLFYERGLVVSQAYYMEGPIGRHPSPGHSRETTIVGGTEATAELWKGSGGQPSRADVTWMVGRLFYAVSGPGLTKADVVAVARSMAP
jgi:hypothetical protein